MISAPSSLTDRDPFRHSHPSGMNLRSTRTRWRRAARRICASAVFACSVATLSVLPAAADFRVCNNTSSRVEAATVYKDKDGGATEGWWNLPSRSGCEVLLRGTLASRYYYIYAVDYDRGGEWSGQAYMCTRDKEFTIRGIADCLARGYDRTGFFEVDTGEQRAWTVQLTESSEQSPTRPLQQYTPLIPTQPGGRPGGPQIQPGFPT